MFLTECTCKRETAVWGLQFLWKGLVTNVENIKKNFGFGCMRLPMNGSEVDTEETCRMVDAFLEAGFNYFDTALYFFV